jgi:hypothetical protein
MHVGKKKSHNRSALTNHCLNPNPPAATTDAHVANPPLPPVIAPMPPAIAPFQPAPAKPRPKPKPAPPPPKAADAEAETPFALWLEKKSPSFFVGWQSRFVAFSNFKLWYSSKTIDIPVAEPSDIKCIPFSDIVQIRPVCCLT